MWYYLPLFIAVVLVSIGSFLYLLIKQRAEKQVQEQKNIFLVEKSRRDALADMAPGVGHQFNNRLMAITSTAEASLALMKQKPLEEFTQEELKSLLQNSKTAFNQIVEEAFKGKSIAQAIQKRGEAKLTYAKTDLAPILQNAIDLLNISCTKPDPVKTIEPDIILDIEDKIPKLILNESIVEDIFYNLIDNARDAIIAKEEAIKENKIASEPTPYKGRITVSARRNGDKITVLCEDNGIGMEEEDKKKLFVAYFTKKPTAQKSAGIGLYAIRGFIEAHKGTISVESEYAKGTTFTIEFPVHTSIEKLQD